MFLYNIYKDKQLLGTILAETKYHAISIAKYKFNAYNCILIAKIKKI